MTERMPHRRGTLRRLLILLAVVLFLCCTGAVIAGYRMVHLSRPSTARPARAATDAFLTRLERDDTAGAYRLLCPEVRAHLSQATFTTVVRGRPRLRAHVIVGTSVATVNRVPTALVDTDLTWVSGGRDRHT